MEKPNKPYHEPDTIWAVFDGVNDFASFVDKIVIVGKFHKEVPTEVVNGYRAAEYIMAYSWYHYPLMDEALTKLLRTMELAVKLRCEQLGISLTITKKDKEVKKFLGSLIEELKDKEPNKNIAEILKWLKEIRNLVMHSDRGTVFGVIAINHAQECLLMFNALFLSDKLFYDSKVELKKITMQLKEFENEIFVNEYLGLRCLFFKIEVTEAYFTNKIWHYLLIIHVVPNNYIELSEKKCFSTPLIYKIKEIQINEALLSGVLVDTEEIFHLQLNQHLQNVQESIQLNRYKENLTEQQLAFSQLICNSEIEKATINFRLQYWCK